MAKNAQQWNARGIVGLLVVVVLLVLGIALTSTPPRMVVGIVQTSGMRRVGRFDGRFREVATVRLADGSTVLAYAKSADPVSAGDAVTLSKQPAVLGDPNYTVVARNKQR